MKTKNTPSYRFDFTESCHVPGDIFNTRGGSISAKLHVLFRQLDPHSSQVWRVRDVCLVKERLCAKVALSKCQIIHRCIRLLRFLFLLCIVIFFVIFSYSMNTVNIFLNKYCPLTGSNQRSLVSKVTTLPVEQHNHFYGPV